jgi:cytochrome bd-type quinol oxidase subunit 1
MLKKIYLIVVSVSLATIVSCSSVRKTKTLSEVKENTTKISESTNSVKENVTNNVTGSSNVKAEKQGLQIEYEPTFDADGKLIPFSFKGTSANGTQTSVDITGNGKVKYFTESQVENMVNTLQEAYGRQLDSIGNKTDKVVSDITIKEKNKTVAPDYFKFIIILGVLLLLFSAGLVVMYFYFKKKILNITKLIPLP